MLSSAKSTSSSFLVWHQGALGDFLLALPVFQGLHRLHPNAVIHFCTKASHYRLLATEPYPGELYPAESSALALLFHDELWSATRLPVHFHHVRGAFVMGQAQSRVLADRLGHLLQKPVVWIQSFPGVDQCRPVTDFLLDQLKPHGWDLPYAPPMLKALPEESRFAKEWLSALGATWQAKPVMIHPGSGGRSKIWPLRRWYALLRWLLARFSHPILAVFGPADAHLKPFAREVQKLGVTIMEDMPLERLAAFLAESALYIGNDSGVSHLAAAMGIPTIALFGPTRPEIWAPRGTHVEIVKSCWSDTENLIWPSYAAIEEIDMPLLTLVNKTLS